ncbi:MAG: hypothetical protein DPW18_07070 [Chloroflexi bacterium]|nr:hypothetical protein [Chloroflexota bacterium]MDL1942320.1 hypothetical protein [Chloroflexi bacterium CFX2]
MRRNSLPRWQISELFIPVSVLLILAWYTYGILFAAPYAGFTFNNNTARVMDVYPQPGQTPSLQRDDILVQIGDVSWEDYKKDARVVLFEGVQPGESVEIAIVRNGVEMVVPWKFPGFSQTEFNARFINIWWLAFFFWVFGAAAQLLIRPKDQRLRLFAAVNYLTALWLIFGSLSSRHLWESSILLHAVTWLLLPVYLHLHWVFPHPLKELPKAAWAFTYLMGLLLAAAEIFQFLPKSLYAAAFLIAVMGSVIFQVVRYKRHPEQRRDVRLLGISIFVAFFPSFVLGILVIAGAVPQLGPAALFALPFMPLVYFYVIYRRRPGGMEVRLTRSISLYAFLIFFGTALFVLVVPITSLEITVEISIFIGALVVVASMYVAVAFFPRFQAFVEKRFLGIKLPYQNLTETYSSRITTSTSIPHLLQLLEEEVFPSLLIRQYAFMQVRDGSLKPLLAKNAPDNQLPDENGFDGLIARAGKYIPSPSTPEEWIRLILPLKVGSAHLGFWLLGQRDPDDLYPSEEISILQAIANQTAIALSNILHAEQLRKMYQIDIERTEQERMHLALELHDSILNQLGYLRRNLDESSLSPNFQPAYEELTRRLREIVSDLRPPMLTYGLKPAIESLAENLMERNSDRVKVKVDLNDGRDRIPEHMELHIFRIAQEACENALRHAGAKTINIYGNMTSRALDLCIEDDGRGFGSNVQLDLDALLSNNHFGLANMVERARLIGADIQIQPGPERGVRVRIAWHSET